MLTFREFLQQTADNGGAVNTLFEARLFDLVDILRTIADALTQNGISHELIGGLAVLIHVEEADPSQAVLTRDVDIMIERPDFESVKLVAADRGFEFRHAAGVDMLLFHGDKRNAVHLLFSGEKVRPNQATPNPAIHPVTKSIHGYSVSVIPLADLVGMKLSSNRDKDRVHIRSMDAAGLLTDGIERDLSSLLRERLLQIRATE